MKVLHICLASHYTEGMTYQDNQLADQNALDGHEVVVVSDCFRYKGHSIEEIEAEDVILSSGIRLVRMKYDNIVNAFMSSKIRKVSKLEGFLYDFKPDVILFHGVAGYEMLTVSKYKKDNPLVKLYIDSHEDYHNSGTVWLSMFFQYKIFNRWIVRKIRKNVDKFLYLSYESRDFCQEIYGLKNDELEFYPLGGNIIDSDVKHRFRAEVIQQLGLSNDDILIVHSGKFAREKKTQELLESFISVRNEKLKLILIGSIPPEMQLVLYPLIESDHRVHFLGWMNSDELVKYLCAADIYAQPGTQSATMQNAICCGTPVALYPYESHVPYVVNNGIFIKNKADYVGMFAGLAEGQFDLGAMSAASYVMAYDLLDYRKLAERLYR
ncbi:glycosyltransferase family 4 protein [Aeromonas veronii]|uniref:glycosyltransferase family 4 protein n=1 Tax=Aeromonas veronii TaxID=654 RepID=UPI00111AAB2C|nr:glycosyltransferase family 4 protein [Aeromonas veronii]MCX0420756.1 glycosyltransferase family 4 protein [Aeromonas veronii]TNI74160.1 glycosyl transferase family 1 [Aeromonas veronii]WIJ40586.1 glycosyltransferase family 4 protein [Aeromonas veronii]